MKSPITTHVLDLSLGKPAHDLALSLEFKDADGNWSIASSARTNQDGRVEDLVETGSLKTGCYRITFDIQSYFDRQSKETFYPCATIHFNIRDTSAHYHVPLLLSPWGYSTYRGS